MKYKVEISGSPIESHEMQEVIAGHLKKRKVELDPATLETVTEAVMTYIYKLNMEWKRDNPIDEEDE